MFKVNNKDTRTMSTNTAANYCAHYSGFEEGDILNYYC